MKSNDTISSRSIKLQRPIRRPRTLGRGVSLVELLIALAISAMLLTATMVATDACFKAYANAAEQASSQAATRMVSQRLLTMLRTSTAQGPLVPDGAANPPVTLSGSTISSNFIEMIDSSNKLIKIEYDSVSDELRMTRSDLGGGNAVTQPLLSGVTAAQFSLLRRKGNDGLWVLERGTMDLTVVPGSDSTLSLEDGVIDPIRVIASTMPRKLE
jgi:prepilin-type N-terminal cleavage/methylation domain-containing protein